jgi:hypothetical protein
MYGSSSPAPSSPGTFASFWRRACALRGYTREALVFRGGILQVAVQSSLPDLWCDDMEVVKPEPQNLGRQYALQPGPEGRLPFS